MSGPRAVGGPGHGALGSRAPDRRSGTTPKSRRMLPIAEARGIRLLAVIDLARARAVEGSPTPPAASPPSLQQVARTYPYARDSSSATSQTRPDSGNPSTTRRHAGRVRRLPEAARGVLRRAQVGRSRYHRDRARPVPAGQRRAAGKQRRLALAGAVPPGHRARVPRAAPAAPRSWTSSASALTREPTAIGTSRATPRRTRECRTSTASSRRLGCVQRNPTADLRRGGPGGGLGFRLDEVGWQVQRARDRGEVYTAARRSRPPARPAGGRLRRPDSLPRLRPARSLGALLRLARRAGPRPLAGRPGPSRGLPPAGLRRVTSASPRPAAAARAASASGATPQRSRAPARSSPAAASPRPSRAPRPSRRSTPRETALFRAAFPA